MTFRQFLTLHSCFAAGLRAAHPVPGPAAGVDLSMRILAARARFFGRLTDAADAAHEALMTHVVGMPVIFLALGAGFRHWPLRAAAARGHRLPRCAAHARIASMGWPDLLKGAVHRLRPEVQFGARLHRHGLWASRPAQRLVSLLLTWRSISACSAAGRGVSAVAGAAAGAAGPDRSGAAGAGRALPVRRVVFAVAGGRPHVCVWLAAAAGCSK